LHGAKNWALISKEFSKKYGIHTKIGKQCRERWNNNLNPSLSKGAWTAKEEKILFDLHKIHGNKWSVIASGLKGRTDNSTKNHFYTIVRKNLRKYNKSVPENKQLKQEDIKNLLKDPEFAKVLLKKPGHYYQKKGAKKTLSGSPSKKSLKSSSRSSIRNIDFEAVRPTLEKITFGEEKKTKAVIKVRRSSTHSSFNGDQTPGSGLTRFSLSTIDMNNENTGFLPSPRYFDSHTASTRSSNISLGFNLSDINPKTPRGSIEGCKNDRTGSIISNDGFNLSRRGSRNNTNESLEIPTLSRKQSTKASDDKNLPGADIEKLLSPFIAGGLPPYSLETKLSFHKTPRSSNHLI